MQPMKNIVFENAYQKNARTLLDKLNSAEAILVGAAAGMSASCGYNFFYQNDAIFQKYLGDFHKKYGFTGAFNGFYYHYPSPEAHWAFLVRMGYMEYECPTGQPYYDLMELLEGKNYHIMTTNQDFQFTRVVSEEKLSAIQGDSRYYQCSRRCHDQIYYNKDMVYAMNAAIDENLCIPAKMIPRCPKCGAQMEPWVRGYTFLEGAKYRDEYRKINEFLEKNKEKKILFLELGVGRMTPMFIQEPFWNLTYFLPKAFYITIISRKCYLEQPGPVMEDLYRLVGSKDYFIVTSNGEDHFVPAGFDRDKVFEMEGRLTQSRCQNGCGTDPYENQNEILKMAEAEKNGQIPSELVPCCSCCGGPVTVNMANSNAFFQTEQFQKKMQDYQNFIKKYHGKRLAILELGVGWRNRMIKEPFMSLAASEPEAVYITFNKGEVYIPSEIAGKSIGVDGDIGEALKEICLARENL